MEESSNRRQSGKKWEDVLHRTPTNALHSKIYRKKELEKEQISYHPLSSYSDIIFSCVCLVIQFYLHNKRIKSTQTSCKLQLKVESIRRRKSKQPNHELHHLFDLRSAFPFRSVFLFERTISLLKTWNDLFNGDQAEKLMHKTRPFMHSVLFLVIRLLLLPLLHDQN